MLPFSSPFLLSPLLNRNLYRQCVSWRKALSHSRYSQSSTPVVISNLEPYKKALHSSSSPTRTFSDSDSGSGSHNSCTYIHTTSRRQVFFSFFSFFSLHDRSGLGLIRINVSGSEKRTKEPRTSSCRTTLSSNSRITTDHHGGKFHFKCYCGGGVIRHHWPLIRSYPVLSFGLRL